MSEKNISISVIWDKLGLSLSALCAIHCLFVPVVIALMPLSPLALTIEHWLHPIFALLIAPTIIYAVRRSHFNKRIVTLLSFGFLFILAGWLIGDFLLEHGHTFETVSTLTGSVLLIAGHWQNYRHHQTCNNSSHHHHPYEETLFNKEEIHETT
ncbi:MerC domain-containing protein [Gracilimonas tropica]|uniref:MerC domain-containing protein n=1 Tax=Gracilimonas tropica TaxID=454600 RepID=UPI00039C0DCD|nr:MerC domain-containing protein [Gracilimonas tropica]